MGSIFGLCTQYLLRTDEMEYHIRPLDAKHAVLLPVGHEGEFKMKKDLMFLRVPDDKKGREYQVISMQPVNSGAREENSSYRSTQRPTDSRAVENPDMTDKQVTNRPPQ